MTKDKKYKMAVASWCLALKASARGNQAEAFQASSDFDFYASKSWAKKAKREAQAAVDAEKGVRS